MLTIRSTTTVAPVCRGPAVTDAPASDTQHLTPSSPPAPHQNGSNDTPRERHHYHLFPTGRYSGSETGRHPLGFTAQEAELSSALSTSLGQARHDLSMAEGKWGLELDSRREVLPPPPAAQALSQPVHPPCFRHLSLHLAAQGPDSPLSTTSRWIFLTTLVLCS